MEQPSGEKLHHSEHDREHRLCECRARPGTSRREGWETVGGQPNTGVMRHLLMSREECFPTVSFLGALEVPPTCIIFRSGFVHVCNVLSLRILGELF